MRFMEVDVRAFGSTDVQGYDGVVIAGSEAEGAADVVDSLLHDVAHAGANVVVGIARAGELPARLQRMTTILVTSGARDPVERAEAVGLRTAKVAAWVRHGLGHEAEGQHTHAHHHH